MAMIPAHAQARVMNQDPPPLVLARTAAPFRSSQFGGFKLESESQVRKPEHRCDPKLAGVIDAWKRFSLPITGDDYSAALEAVAGLNCSAPDLLAFFESFLKLQDVRAEYCLGKKAGLFISALVNTGSSKCYTLPTYLLDYLLDFIGSHNTKQLVIHGNVGAEAGAEMGRGLLMINGEAGMYAARNMRGGRMIIRNNPYPRPPSNANVLYWAGRGMEGGKLIIEGFGGHGVGDYMTGGEIHLLGAYDTIGTVKGGRIFFDGKQLYPIPAWEEAGVLVYK